MESLVKVGAMSRFGHAAQLLAALDDAMAAGQSAQRDRMSGQTSLFDIAASPEELERPLPAVPEALSRERLRWEKELLGLYLSEHPLGSLAEQLAQYVTAYSGDLKDESLDGQRVVMGGIVTAIRTVTTRNKETMAVATFEDLQGTLEIVVFPRMYATSGATFGDGAILLVAGRVDHRGEEASLLADTVWVWEDAAARGPAAIAQEAAAGERSRGNRRWGQGGAGNNGNGNGYGGNGNGNGFGKPAVPGASVAPGVSAVAAAAGPVAGLATAPSGPASMGPAPTTSPSATPNAPKMRVSPLRGGGVTPFPTGGQPASAVRPASGVPMSGSPAAPPPPAEPLASAPAPEDLAALAPEREEPPLPDEARAVAARASAAPTAPLEAPASGILNVRFTRGADTARIVLAMEELRAMLKQRPGATRVVFHLPGPAGATLPMEVRGGVAYDAELLAEVQRRLGEGLVHLEISTRAWP
jgi:hypothetical protein